MDQTLPDNDAQINNDAHKDTDAKIPNDAPIDEEEMRTRQRKLERQVRKSLIHYQYFTRGRIQRGGGCKSCKCPSPHLGYG